ncbi:hypothetical protein [Pseudoclavibacter sp. AY1F1]|uniref:hypothetical protein n=1 Tax=Pseudoclavibacter sp. AY1F1 TaxID=2080583 RepID=UPI002157E102|nr:hypothetical protein [Pseudoclavibacter sp. AY1F1]
MPRSNRSRRQGGETSPKARGGRAAKWQQAAVEREAGGADQLEHLRDGWRRTEVRRGISYTVQPIAAARAVKAYVCPACQNPVEAGTAHVVVWRAEGILGDEQALAARRHWHNHCWRMA